MLHIERIRSEFWYQFLSSPGVMIAAAIIGVIVLACACADVLAPQNAFDETALDLVNSKLPPVWMQGGDDRFLLGTDALGRDVLSAMLYGGRVSIIVGLGAVVLSVVIGVSGGLIAGYFGGMADAVIMRVAEVQFSFPPILIALLLNGVLKTALTPGQFQIAAVPILIGAIGLSGWVQYARVVRAGTLAERHKEYVLACEATGFGEFYILRRHVLPNILGPVLVISMLQLAVAIVTEATLSFLGLGTPVTQPSLGALIQSGSEFLFSGVWWVVIFPGALLLILVLAFNVVADWLRDVLNPRLR
jgi:peptide/nickel transport system permease protein